MTQKGRSRREKVILVFGEDPNDTNSIKELLLGLCPGFPGKIKAMRRPPVYSRGTSPRDVKSQVKRMCVTIKTAQATAEVVCVFVHRDCDALEPAHIQQGTEIEKEFSAQGFQVVAVNPAWEFEAWLFLWPEAVAAYRQTWNSLHRYKGRRVGLIRNAKEEFRRAVRAHKSQGRDYRESDAPGIVKQARLLELINAPQARSDSFDHFRDRVNRMIPSN